METLGPKVRRRRRRLGLTLDELAGRSGISKPYLSLIENERVSNPSDAKLRRLEETLGFQADELLAQAHLQRTPRVVRAVLDRLISNADAAAESGAAPDAPQEKEWARQLALVAASAHAAERAPGRAVPIINRPGAPYPTDFTDLSYPSRVADDSLSCPDMKDTDAFGVRVSDDSMLPRYRPGDIVIFSPALTAQSGDDCFIRFKGGRTIFRRVFLQDEPGNAVVRLQPLNDMHPARVLPAAKVSGIYRAIACYQRVGKEVGPQPANAAR